MPLPRVGAPRWGIPRFRVLDQFRLQAPHQHFGAQGCKFGPPSLGFSFTGLPTYDRCRQHYSCSLYQQTGGDPFPYPVMSSSGSVPMATNSRHRHWVRHIQGCLNVIGLADHLSWPKPAINNRVESPPRNSDPYLQDVGNSNIGHVCHNPQHASSPVYVSNPRASSTGDRCSVTRLAGEVNVHVSTIPPA